MLVPGPEFFRRLENVRICVSDDGQPGCPSGAGKPNAVPCLRRRVRDVTLVSNKGRKQPDLELHLALQHEPELGASHMKMAPVLFSRRRLRLGIASNYVSDAPSVADKLILVLLWPLLSGNGFVVVDKWYVRLIVGALHVCNRRLHKCHAGRQYWSLIYRVHCVRIGDRDLET